MRRVLVVLIALAIGVASPLRAQEAPTSIAAAAQQMRWNEPAEPMKLVGPIHFVGTQGLTSWLITTNDGHMLLNTGMPPSGELIEASIRKLGFKPEDVKLLLTCHAHIDHVGGLAYLKRATGAQVVALDAEVELIQSGGKTDFNYGTVADFQFEPVEVDRVIHDGDKVTLGDVTLQALKTAGHTRGSTTWVTQVTDGGRRFTVVFPDGTSVNPGYRLVKDASYAGIADDYRKTFRTLAALTPDIWLTPHTEPFAFEAKRARVATEGVAAWVDPEGYRKWVALQRERFEAAVTKESAPEVSSADAVAFR
jgi:metallo-beta-lactamase class B